MHLVFGRVSKWSAPLLRILKHFKLNVFYIYVVAQSESKKIQIAEKLKEFNITPLPIEFKQHIPSNSGWQDIDADINEFAYKKNIELVPDSTLKKYTKLFFNNQIDHKKTRIILQETLTKEQSKTGVIGIWAGMYPKTKIIYISFRFLCFYLPSNFTLYKNIHKVVIPVDIFLFFAKAFKNFLLSFLQSFNNRKLINKNINKMQGKKEIALVTHQGITYGSYGKKEHKLYDKTLYYLDDPNSPLNKYNILHLDYSNYPSPEENIHWICIKKIKISKNKFFFKTLLGALKTFYLVRNWSTFLGWLLLIYKYSSFLKYYEAVKKIEGIKFALIDYEALCPATLILAFEQNNIKTIATQERFIHAFYQSKGIILDTYYVASEFVANVLNNSKYYDVKKIIPVGQYKSDYISFYKSENLPEEISKAKRNGKKIVVALGYHAKNNWLGSYTSLVQNWSSQVHFLEDMIELSKNLKDAFIILRFKTLNWAANPYFKDILNKINECENIAMSSNYKESYFTYKLCAHADLIIGKQTSVLDECLVHEIPILVHDYTHNLKKIIADCFNYSSTTLVCYNFQELLERSKSLLSSNSNKQKDEVLEISRKVFYVKGEGTVKNKIIKNLENLINENKF